jgi:hypothetical protein
MEKDLKSNPKVGRMFPFPFSRAVRLAKEHGLVNGDKKRIPIRYLNRDWMHGDIVTLITFEPEAVIEVTSLGLDLMQRIDPSILSKAFNRFAAFANKYPRPVDSRKQHYFRVVFQIDSGAYYCQFVRRTITAKLSFDQKASHRNTVTSSTERVETLEQL